MNPQTIFKNLLRQHSFTLVRQNKHYVYTDGRGRVLVVAKTPSDHFAYNSMIRDLKAVVSNPPPSSLTIEEERQRRELEKNIVLWAERKKNISAKKCNGNGGGHGHSKSGSGFYYQQAREAPFVPEEVKEEARLNKEWDNLLYHCKKQSRRVENELERIYDAARTMSISKTAREQTAYIVREVRAGKYDQDISSRQERERLGMFIGAGLDKGKCANAGAVALEMLIASADPEHRHVSATIEIPGADLGEAIREQINQTLWGALYLTMMIWAHMDGRKPMWLEPFAAEVRKLPLTDRARRMINRMQRGVRTRSIADRFMVEIVEAMGRIPK